MIKLGLLLQLGFLALYIFTCKDFKLAAVKITVNSKLK